MATYASNGTQADVVAGILLSSAGDIVTLPASGTFTWGAAGTSIIVNRAIQLTNLGCTIVMSTTGNIGSDSVIAVTTDNSKLNGTWIITGASNGSFAVTPISISAKNIRVTGITYTSPSTGGYFIYCSDATGVCDHCTVIGSGQLQTFMIRGLKARWDVAHTMGTSNAFFVEDCDIDSPYAQENDGAAASVIRFNTLRSGATLDMHFIETSTTADAGTNYHGSRQFEGYNNTYTSLANGYQWVRACGGTGMIFNNVVPQQAGSGGAVHYIALIFEWGTTLNGISDGLAYVPTPAHSPIPDQIGMGPYVSGSQTAGAEPFYYWNNQETDGTDNPLLGYNAISAAAISAYGSSFFATSEDGSPYMYLRGREYFRGVVGGTFPSTTDVGRGTKAAMNASSPTAVGQAWWVTDEGSWNTKLAANTSGQLYRWSGSAWVLYYTPYTYPHPLQNASSGTTGIAISGALRLSGAASLR